MNIEKANRAIRDAWIAGIISAIINLVVSLGRFGGQDIRGLVDVFLISGLTFGIYKKSRICALAMFVYFVINKVILISEGNMPTNWGIMWVILFGYIFFQGIRGTFVYHKIIKGKDNIQ